MFIFFSITQLKGFKLSSHGWFILEGLGLFPGTDTAAQSPGPRRPTGRRRRGGRGPGHAAPAGPGCGPGPGPPEAVRGFKLLKPLLLTPGTGSTSQ